MARRWTIEEWDELFSRYPPITGNKPDRAARDALARRFDRTAGAIEWMWDDSAEYRAGKPATASQRLKDYLDRRY